MSVIWGGYCPCVKHLVIKMAKLSLFFFNRARNVECDLNIYKSNISITKHINAVTFNVDVIRMLLLLVED